MNIYSPTAPRIQLWLTALLLSGCATMGTVRTERPLDEQVERPEKPDVQLTTQLAATGSAIEVVVRRKTTFKKFDKVQIRSAHKFTDGTTPALIWSGFGVGTALTGLIVRWAETQQPVERARYVSGGVTAVPEVSNRTRPAKSRVGSSIFFATGGTLVAVGLGQLAAPLVPSVKVTKRIDERYVDSRTETTQVSQAPVSLSIADTEVATGLTDTNGRAVVDLGPLQTPATWSWTGVIRTEGMEAKVDLKNSTEAGQAAGQWAQQRLTSGMPTLAKAAMAHLEPHQRAYLPAWEGFCSGASTQISSLSSPGQARELLPANASDTCRLVIQGIAGVAAAQLRAALKDKDTRLAYRWLPLTDVDQQDKYERMIDQLDDRLEAAEVAAERTLLRRQRQTWKVRTDRALAACASTQTELWRRKDKVQRLARAGQMGQAQTELDRLEDWMESTGESRMGDALDDIRAIKDEMDEQDISDEVQMPWMRRVAGACGD